MVQTLNPRRVARSGLLLGSTGSPVSPTASLPLHTSVSDSPHSAVAFLSRSAPNEIIHVLIELLSVHVSDDVYLISGLSFSVVNCH